MYVMGLPCLIFSLSLIICLFKAWYIPRVIFGLSIIMPGMVQWVTMKLLVWQLLLGRNNGEITFTVYLALYRWTKYFYTIYHCLKLAFYLLFGADLNQLPSINRTQGGFPVKPSWPHLDCHIEGTIQLISLNSNLVKFLTVNKQDLDVALWNQAVHAGII